MSRIQIGTVVLFFVLAVPAGLQLAGTDRENPRQLVAAADAEPGLLHGGDTRAWLSNRGSHTDSGYCSAELALPLSNEISWEFAYSAAEFSQTSVRGLLHYDGTVLATARSAQALGLDLATGAMQFNIRVADRDSVEKLEDLQRVVLTPAGLMACKDGTGRVYCWDLQKGNDGQKWIRPGNDMLGGIAAADNAVFFGSVGSVYSVNAQSGRQDWESPSLYQFGGIVCSEDGIVVCWPSDGHKLLALDEADGSLRWAWYPGQQVDVVNIDPWRRRVLVWHSNETVTALSLDTGSIEWEYSWSWMLTPEQREELKWQYFEQTRQNRDTNFRTMRIRVNEPMAGPDVLAATLKNGDVICLSPEGRLLWHYKGQAESDSGILFNNGLLFRELWLNPRLSYAFLYPLKEKFPDWEVSARRFEQENAAFKANPAAPRRRGYSRVVVLDLANGSVRSVFEPEAYGSSPLLPAGDKIVYGEISDNYLYHPNPETPSPRRILAYNWLVPQEQD